VSLNRTQFHRVTYRHRLFMSGEREPAMLVTGIAVGLPMLAQNLPSFITGILLWVCAMPALRRMAKSDQQMLKVYIRNIRYAGYYSPRSRPCIGHSSKWQTVLSYALPVALLSAIYLRYWRI
jgi:type IV secretory pathway TrbD component